MKKAYVFPGQGAQYPGMALPLFEKNEKVRDLFQRADQILGFPISEVMFRGSEEDLKQTRVTQPAVFLHSVSVALALGEDTFVPDMVAGHSLGEFSALVASRALDFEEGLKLVSERAMAMQKACEANPSTMAAILGLADEDVRRICESITDEVVVAANFNCPGQVVISGSMKGIEKACELMKEAGAKRALPLKVGGAFHSPLMDSARVQLAEAIERSHFQTPICPIYQNVTALPSSDPAQIKANLISQLTAPVRWTEAVRNMIADGATTFVELGPGNVLQGLVKKINKDVATEGYDCL